jgi:sodium transport system ATP-binding protein
VLKPTSGSAFVAGYDVAAQPEQVRARIGFLSNNTGIYDRMTAREMVEHFGRLYGIPEESLQPRINELFERLQMANARDMLCSKMSTGMKQKVSIARTVIHDPPVLIFDEPTTGLDVLVARKVIDEVKALRDQGKCIIYSTHIMREVEKLCHRIAIIYRGKILAMGSVAELAEQYGEPDMEELFFKLIDQHEEDLVSKSVS